MSRFDLVSPFLLFLDQHGIETGEFLLSFIHWCSAKVRKLHLYTITSVPQSLFDQIYERHNYHYHYDNSC